MALEIRFKFPLENGLHARPASCFEAVAGRFKSAINLVHEKSGAVANLRSVLSMVSADVRYEDRCRIRIDGEDEAAALAAVEQFIREELPHCDEALPSVPDSDAELHLPRSLKAAGLTEYVRGKAVGGGIGFGKVVLLGGGTMPAIPQGEPAGDSAHEQQRAKAAIAAVDSELADRIESARHPQEIQVLKAHSSIVRDAALSDMIDQLILSQNRTAPQAIVVACTSFHDTLAGSKSAYLRERVLDVQDVCTQLLDRVLNNGSDRSSASVNGSAHSFKKAVALTGPSVCVADHLTPGQFLSLDRAQLKGLVLTEGGTTSHTVILARSMNIPTLVGVARSSTVSPGREVIVDGNLGLLVTEIPEPVRRYYTSEQHRLAERRRQLESFVARDGMTADGHPVEVGVNIASAEEATVAFDAGAQGIGLFRTEMLFMDRDEAPSEQEQTEIYTAALKAAGGRPVIIRTLDIGGDKPASYLNLPAEENPFLGYRGARLYREFSTLVKSQLRAILRASVHGQVKILVPMVCCLEEVVEVKQMLAESAEALRAEGVVLEKLPPLGLMIEIPSAAFLMPELCSEVDFFSVGSNDLIQYFLAADRANPKVAPLYKWSHPAFLRLLKSVVDQAHAAGKWVGLCGEMGDQPTALPLLVGLGFDEISVSSPRVGAVKSAIGHTTFEQCTALVNTAICCGTTGAVESLLDAVEASARSAPILTPKLIITVDGVTKEEVIKQLADSLYQAGRVAEPRLLEEAIWKREDTYSTGFGHGFAVPHCKTDHLSANTIAIARLAAPVVWGSLDGNPVDVVILLAIREKEHAQAHMKIFAKLSRLVMRDEFRDHVRAEADPDRLAAFLDESLGLTAAAL